MLCLDGLVAVVCTYCYRITISATSETPKPVQGFPIAGIESFQGKRVPVPIKGTVGNLGVEGGLRGLGSSCKRNLDLKQDWVL